MSRLPGELARSALSPHELAAIGLFKEFLLGDAARSEATPAVYDDLVVRLAMEMEAPPAAVAEAINRKGIKLTEDNLNEASFRISIDLLTRFAAASDESSREAVANMLNRDGVELTEAGNHEAAIKIYHILLALFGTATELPLREVAGKALINMGFSLTATGHHKAAIAVQNDLLARFRTATELPLRELVAKALLNKGFTLGEAGRSKAAIAAYNDLLARFDTAPELPLRELVAKALVNKRFTLGEAGRNKAAIEVCDILLARFGTAPELALRELVANALHDTVGMLTKGRHHETAIKVCDVLLARFGTATELPLREHVAAALLKLGASLGADGLHKAAIGIYDILRDRFGTATELPLRQAVAEAVLGKGFSLGADGRHEASIVALREAAKFEWQRQDIPALIQELLKSGEQTNDDTEEYDVNHEKDELVLKETGSGYTGPKEGEDTPPEETRGLPAPGDFSGTELQPARAEKDFDPMLRGGFKQAQGEATSPAVTRAPSDDARILASERPPSLRPAIYRKRDIPPDPESVKNANQVLNQARTRKKQGYQFTEAELEIVRAAGRVKSAHDKHRRIAKQQPQKRIQSHPLTCS